MSEKLAASALSGEIGSFWQEALELERLPHGEESFFECGGDSLAAFRLQTLIEKHWAIEVPVTSFFHDPTVSNLVDLVAEQIRDGVDQSRSKENNVERVNKPAGLIREIQSYVASWRGERLFEDSLVVGMNTSGSARPVFWIFQGHDEFEALATQLGPDQPLYGLRSCSRIVSVPDYYPETIDEILNRYLWEIMAVAGDGPFALGGNCQGALLAFHIAQRLRQARRKPDLLILMEWSFACGSYPDPVLLIFGRESYTAKLYRSKPWPGLDWRADFPAYSLASIPGAHTRFFEKPSVSRLAAAITRYNAH